MPEFAVLDGVGLLLFVIPGIIAFAVDFSTGRYLSAGNIQRFCLDPKDIK